MNMIAAGLMIFNCTVAAQDPKEGQQEPSPTVTLSEIEPLHLMITAPRPAAATDAAAAPSAVEAIADAPINARTYPDSSPFRDSPTTFYHGFDLLGMSRLR